MALEITAIVCGTIAFLATLIIGSAALLARKAAKTPPVPTLDEIFEQTKSFLTEINAK